jgi:hypothetical protein
MGIFPPHARGATPNDWCYFDRGEEGVVITGLAVELPRHLSYTRP